MDDLYAYIRERVSSKAFLFRKERVFDALPQQPQEDIPSSEPIVPTLGESVLESTTCLISLPKYSAFKAELGWG